jgi:hypothetical protein
LGKEDVVGRMIVASAIAAALIVVPVSAATTAEVTRES